MANNTRKIIYNPEPLWLARRRLNMTQDDLAERAKKTRLTVHRVEHGKHASEKVVRQFCEILEVPLDSVLIS